MDSGASAEGTEVSAKRWKTRSEEGKEREYVDSGAPAEGAEVSAKRRKIWSEEGQEREYADSGPFSTGHKTGDHKVDWSSLAKQYDDAWQILYAFSGALAQATDKRNDTKHGQVECF